MAKSTVAVKFLGDVADLKNKINDVDGGLSGIGSKFNSVGKVAAAGFAVAGAAVVGFAAKSADTFSKVGGEVLKLVRYTGATAEEASRLRFAGTQAGIGVDTMTKSLGILSKGLATTKFDKLGLDLKNADGSAKPLNQSLLNIAQRFQGMENGPAKTALAMQLFGKAGADMIPFLNKGADGIKELEAQSDKYGNTLSGKDLQAVKESTANHRLFTAAMQGLQIQVGRYVLPIMTKFSGLLVSVMPGAIAGVKIAVQALSPVFGLVGKGFDLLGRVVSDFVSTWKNFQDGTTSGGFFGQVEKLAITGAKAFDLVRRGVSDFVQTWKNFQDGTTSSGTFGAIERAAIRLRVVFNEVSEFVEAHARPILIAFGVALGLLISPIAVVVAGLVLAYAHFEGFRRVVDGVVQFLATQVLPIIVSTWASIAATTAEFVAGLIERWNAISEAVGHVVNFIRDIVTPVLNVIAALWRAWGDDLLNIVRTVYGFIASSIENAMHLILGVIDVVLALINGDWGGAWNGIKEIVGAVWAQIQNIISAALSIVQSLIGGVLSTIGQVWNGAWQEMRGALSAAWNAILAAARAGIAVLVAEVVTIPRRIVGGLGNMGTLLFEAGKDLIRGLINGIKSMLGAAVDAVKHVGSSIVDAGKSVLHLKSPSTLFHQFGVLTIQGLINGIRAQAGPLLAQVDEILAPMVQLWQSTMSGLSGRLSLSGSSSIAGHPTTTGTHDTGTTENLDYWRAHPDELEAALTANDRLAKLGGTPGQWSGSSSPVELHMHFDLTGAVLAEEQALTNLANKIRELLAPALQRNGISFSL